MNIDHVALFEKLEAEGEESVRINSIKGIYQGRKGDLVQGWLRDKDASRAESSSAKRDAREEETLAVAKEANAIARSASFAATAAAAAASEANAIARSNRKVAIAAAVIAIATAIAQIIWR